MRAKNIAGPGIQIQRGVLVVGEAQLSYPGDLLHEAAYLAVVPAARRGLLDADAGASRAAPIRAARVSKRNRRDKPACSRG